MNQETKSKAAVETVQMNDGRSVDFAGKRKMLKDVFLNDAENEVSVRFDFRNGETRTFTVPDSLLLKFAGHGASQKIGDETAGESEVDDMVEAVDSIMSRLENGEWGAERAAGGGFSGAGTVVRALMEVSGKSKAEIQAWIEKKMTETSATRQAIYASLRQGDNPVAKRIAELEAAKQSKKGVEVSTEDLF